MSDNKFGHDRLGNITYKEPRPCPHFPKKKGCHCRHCRGICLCHREHLLRSSA